MTDKLKIDKLFCFVVEDDKGEGVPAFQGKLGMMPLVGADMDRVEQLKGMAQIISNNTGKKITLCEFDNRKEIEVIKPE